MSNLTQLRRIERVEQAAAQQGADRPFVEIVIVDHETRDGRVVVVSGEIVAGDPDGVRFGDRALRPFSGPYKHEGPCRA